MLEARSPKYTGLYDPVSGVRFRHGRAEVTEEQAHKLAERRFGDGILIDGVPAKKWAKQQQQPPGGQDSPDVTDGNGSGDGGAPQDKEPA